MAFNSIRSTVQTAEDVEDGGDDPVADHPENSVVIGLQRNRNRKRVPERTASRESLAAQYREYLPRVS